MEIRVVAIKFTPLRNEARMERGRIATKGGSWRERGRPYAVMEKPPLAELGGWASVEIGSHTVIRHAYENVLDSCARLACFATALPMKTDGPINERQEILAADDLVVFAINARRLIDNTASLVRFRSVAIGVGKPGIVSLRRVINILIHHKGMRIMRSRYELNPNPLEVVARSEWKHEYFPPPVAVTSDKNETISFGIKELIETFQSKVLTPILDLCAEQRLYLND